MSSLVLVVSLLKLAWTLVACEGLWNQWDDQEWHQDVALKSGGVLSFCGHSTWKDRRVRLRRIPGSESMQWPKQAADTSTVDEESTH